MKLFHFHILCNYDNEFDAKFARNSAGVYNYQFVAF